VHVAPCEQIQVPLLRQPAEMCKYGMCDPTAYSEEREYFS